MRKNKERLNKTRSTVSAILDLLEKLNQCSELIKIEEAMKCLELLCLCHVPYSSVVKSVSIAL